MSNRQQRDIERLAGRRGDTTQRAILWSELETLAQKLSGMLRTQKAAKAIADQLDEGDLRERAINRSDAIREVNQLIDTTNEFIANEAARLDASDQAIIDVNIAAVEARLGDAEVAVEDEIIARTDGDTALGQQITTVEADLAAAEASVTQNASAIATIESFQAATYSLRVDAGDASSSLELVAADDPVNGPASAVRIRADNILLDGTVLAHHIDTASLTADVGFIGNLFVDTLNIAGNAVTIPLSDTRTDKITGNNTFQKIQSITHTFDTNGVYLILFSGLQSYSAITSHDIEIRTNGNLVQARGGDDVNDYPALLWSGNFIGTTVEISIHWKASSSVEMRNRTLTVLGVKR